MRHFQNRPGGKVLLGALSLVLGACGESPAESEAPTPLAFVVHNPGTVLLNEFTLDVTESTPGSDPRRKMGIGYCVTLVSEPCIEVTTAWHGDIPAGASHTVQLHPVAHTASVGLNPDPAVFLFACAGHDTPDDWAQMELEGRECSDPFQLDVRPNPGLLCGWGGDPIDSVIAIDDPSIICELGDSARVLIVDLSAAQQYAIRFYDVAGERTGGGVTVLGIDGYAHDVSTLSDIGEGFAPPADGYYYIVVDPALVPSLSAIEVEVLFTV